MSDETDAIEYGYYLFEDDVGGYVGMVVNVDTGNNLGIARLDNGSRKRNTKTNASGCN